MKARVNINYRDMQGKVYDIHEIVNIRVTLIYFDENGHRILIDFVKRELELIDYYTQIAVQRNQAERIATLIDYNKKYGYVFQYEMPNGKVFRNVIKNPDFPNKYTAISEAEYARKFKKVN